MLAAGFTVLTPLVSLDTPGKATVQVVILADPDGHEVLCGRGQHAAQHRRRLATRSAAETGFACRAAGLLRGR